MYEIYLNLKAVIVILLEVCVIVVVLWLLVAFIVAMIGQYWDRRKMTDKSESETVYLCRDCGKAE